MLGSKEGEVNRFRSVPLRSSQPSGRDEQVSRQCPRLGKRLHVRGHRHGQSSLGEILEGFLEKEAWGGETFPSVWKPISIITMILIMIIIAGNIYRVFAMCCNHCAKHGAGIHLTLQQLWWILLPLS